MPIFFNGKGHENLKYLQRKKGRGNKIYSCVALEIYFSLYRFLVDLRRNNKESERHKHKKIGYEN
jgi:hypothetical protein